MSAALLADLPADLRGFRSFQALVPIPAAGWAIPLNRLLRAMEWIGVGLALLGVALAIFIPLRVEYERRPRLRIERGDDANVNDPEHATWRIVHIRVFNDPIEGRLAKWLLRNVATGCQVHMRITSLSDGRSLPEFAAKWSARPEPLQYLPVPQPGGGQTIKPFWDPQMEPAGFSYDLSPGENGEPLAVAIKHEGDDEAYAYAAGIYHHMPSGLRHPNLALPHREYRVEVRATAGEIKATREFVLRNEGRGHVDLSLEPVDST